MLFKVKTQRNDKAKYPKGAKTETLFISLKKYPNRVFEYEKTQRVKYLKNAQHLDINQKL